MTASTFTRDAARPTTTPPTSTPAVGMSARRRQSSWVLVGVLLVFGAGLGAALWSSSVSDRQLILVAAHAIDAGEVIGRNDLREASINADADLAAVPSSAIGDVVGQVARSPIPAGAPLQRAVLADAVTVPAGSVVVGLALEPGDFPTSSLRTGDRVEIVETTVGAPSGATSRVLTVGKVWTVERSSASDGGLTLSVQVPADQGAGVANAAATGRLRLLLTSAS